MLMLSKEPWNGLVVSPEMKTSKGLERETKVMENEKVLTCQTSAPAVYSLPFPFQFRRHKRYAEAKVSACMICV